MLWRWLNHPRWNAFVADNPFNACCIVFAIRLWWSQIQSRRVASRLVFGPPSSILLERHNESDKLRLRTRQVLHRFHLISIAKTILHLRKTLSDQSHILIYNKGALIGAGLNYLKYSTTVSYRKHRWRLNSPKCFVVATDLLLASLPLQQHLHLKVSM